MRLSPAPIALRQARRIQRGLVGFLLLACFLVGSVTGLAAEPQFDIYVTAKTDDNDRPIREPERRFACSDKVFTVIHAKGLEPNQLHYLVVDWFDPSGKRREHTTYEFAVPSGERVLWAWLLLHAPTGAGLAHFFDPSIGMGDFIGTWKVNVSMNGDRVGQLSFEVIC